MLFGTRRNSYFIEFDGLSISYAKEGKGVTLLATNLISIIDFRRKTPSSAGNKKALEVNLPESSRKFITCIRKYVMFYLKLLEETGERCTLERAYNSLRADKRVNPKSLLYYFNLDL